MKGERILLKSRRMERLDARVNDELSLFESCLLDGDEEADLTLGDSIDFSPGKKDITPDDLDCA